MKAEASPQYTLVVRRWSASLLSLLLWPGLACGTTGEPEPDGDPPDCAYPDAPDTMALGSALPSFRWGVSQTATGEGGAVDMHRAYCDEDANREWSPFDLLLFVSIPAW